MSQQTLSVVVTRTVRETDRVLSLILADPTGIPLPAWTPGAHVDLVLPSGRIRPYSLSSDPDDNRTYRLGVLREENGHGGSAEVHATELIGRTLKIRGPRSNFRFTPARRTVFIAGGIGITPILPMVRQLHRTGDPHWTLVYGARTRADMAYLDEVEQFTSGTIALVAQDTDGLPNLDRVLSQSPADTAVYCCGPDGLIAAVRECQTKYLPPEAVHFERFRLPISPPSPKTFERNGVEVELRRTGVTLWVPPGRTLLEVIREVLPDVSYSCESGICGACETKVLGGTPAHLDDLASSRTSDSMLICISRARTAKLVLDL